MANWFNKEPSTADMPIRQIYEFTAQREAYKHRGEEGWKAPTYEEWFASTSPQTRTQIREAWKDDQDMGSMYLIIAKDLGSRPFFQQPAATITPQAPTMQEEAVQKAQAATTRMQQIKKEAPGAIKAGMETGTPTVSQELQVAMQQGGPGASLQRLSILAPIIRGLTESQRMGMPAPNLPFKAGTMNEALEGTESGDQDLLRLLGISKPSSTTPNIGGALSNLV